MARPISQSRLGSLHSKSACSLSRRRFAASNGFERYAEYMTKPDEFMCLALPGYRCMGKGQLGPFVQPSELKKALAGTPSTQLEANGLRVSSDGSRHPRDHFHSAERDWLPRDLVGYAVVPMRIQIR